RCAGSPRSRGSSPGSGPGTTCGSSTRGGLPPSHEHQMINGPIPSPFREEQPYAGYAQSGGGGGIAEGSALRSEVHGELRVDPLRERRHAGNAAIDPYDITDIMAKYAPTRGDPSKGNIANEIDFNWKRFETYGKPDYAEARMYADQGWRPVQHHH